MSKESEDQIRLHAIIDKYCDGIFIATYGDFQGEGGSRESAIDSLIIGMEYIENEGTI